MKKVRQLAESKPLSLLHVFITDEHREKYDQWCYFRHTGMHKLTYLPPCIWYHYCASDNNNAMSTSLDEPSLDPDALCLD